MRQQSQSEVVKRWLRFSVVALIAIQPILTAWHSQTVDAETLDPITHNAISPAEDAYLSSKSVTLEWESIVDAVDYQYQVSTTSDFATVVGGGTLSETTEQFEAPVDGNYFWQVRTSNVDTTPGAWDGVTVRVFTIDTQTPTIEIVSTNETTLHDASVTFTATMFDTNPGVMMLATSEGCGLVTGSTDNSITVAIPEVDFESERCTVVANGKDRAGNVAPEKLVKYSVDNLGPNASFSIISSSLSATNGAQLTLQGLTTPGTTVEILTVDGIKIDQTTALASGLWSYDINVTSAGDYSYRVRVTDEFNNEVTSIIQTISIAPYVAPSSDLIAENIISDLTKTTAFNAIANRPATAQPVKYISDQVAELKRTEVDTPAVLAMDATPVAASKSGWRFYGVAWYWLGALVLLVAGLGRLYYRNRQLASLDLPARRISR